jgi:TRAP-type C4-dicarboxylate transport system permease small subunit
VKHLVRGYDALIALLLSGAGIAIAAVCVLIAWDVIARNLGFQPPESTVALTEYALLYVTMAAGPMLVRRRGHVAVEIIRHRFNAALNVACALVAFIISGLAVALWFEAAARGELDTRSFDIGRGWLFAPLAIGFTLMGTEFLRLLLSPAGGEERVSL